MSETLLTKCPHCSTTFRLTSAQLQIAGGAVRCGACYQVFHANEHIVKTAVVEEIRQPPPPQPDPIEEAFELATDEGLDPYDAAEFDMDSSDADLFSEDYRKTMEPESSLDEFGYTEKETTKKKKGVDESWAEDLLKELGDDSEESEDKPDHVESQRKGKTSGITSAASAFSLDDEDDRPQPKKKKTGNDLSDTFLTLGSFSSDDPFAVSDIEEEELEKGDSNDESWAKAMLEELEDEESPRKQAEGLSILMDDEETKVEAANPFGARDLSRDRREALTRAKTAQPKPAKKAETKKTDAFLTDETEEFFRLLDEPAQPTPTQHREPSFALDGLADLDDLESDLRETAIEPSKLFKDAGEPVNPQRKNSSLKYASPKPKSNLGRNLLMALAALLLISAGIGQYVYFNFETVTRNPQLRPWLEQICGKLGCTLPSQVDLNAIVGTNLVVRSHPHERNALVIDVIIKNKAPFEQPFPVVQLSFEDVNGNPIANRRFTPNEYIQDPSIDIRRMPPETPIHLTLEIVDPGKEAVNYQIQFLPIRNAP